MLNAEAETWLALFNGRTKTDTLFTGLTESEKQEMESLLGEFIALLDDNHILDTPRFRTFSEEAEKQFERAKMRPMTCAGSSYPREEKAARAYFDAVFSTVPSQETNRVKAIYAPHIDYRIGLKTYVAAFKALATARPKRIVLLATSHYAGMYFPMYENTPVIASKKEFETPFGLVKTDVETIEKLVAELPLAASGADRAHRIEHSIELHAVLLKYLLPYDFSIVPLLINSFDELLYSDHSTLGHRISDVSEWLQERFGDDADTVFCVSGDLAHIGRKFGDRKNAASLFPEVKRFDALVMEAASRGSAEEVLSIMRTNNDAFRICGFPPLFLLLKSLSHLKGIQTAYDIWDESERQSGVSFSAMIFK